MHSGIDSAVDGLGGIISHPIVVAAITLIMIVCVIQAFRKNKVRMSNGQMDRNAEDTRTYWIFKRIVKWLLVLIPLLVALCWWMLSGSSPVPASRIDTLF